jgi:hypothetical protein
VIETHRRREVLFQRASTADPQWAEAIIAADPLWGPDEDWNLLIDQIMTEAHPLTPPWSHPVDAEAPGASPAVPDDPEPISTEHKYEAEIVAFEADLEGVASTVPCSGGAGNPWMSDAAVPERCSLSERGTARKATLRRAWNGATPARLPTSHRAYGTQFLEPRRHRAGDWRGHRRRRVGRGVLVESGRLGRRRVGGIGDRRRCSGDDRQRSPAQRLLRRCHVRDSGRPDEQGGLGNPGLQLDRRGAWRCGLHRSR